MKFSKENKAAKEAKRKVEENQRIVKRKAKKAAKETKGKPEENRTPKSKPATAASSKSPTAT
jgi:hypothetical protein